MMHARTHMHTRLLFKVGIVNKIAYTKLPIHVTTFKAFVGASACLSMPHFSQWAACGCHRRRRSGNTLSIERVEDAL